MRQVQAKRIRRLTRGLSDRSYKTLKALFKKVPRPHRAEWLGQMERAALRVRLRKDRKAKR